MVYAFQTPNNHIGNSKFVLNIQNNHTLTNRYIKHLKCALCDNKNAS